MITTKIYADHAATTALSRQAYSSMLPWLQEKYGNPSTLYSLARDPRKAVSTARETIADCIGAKPEEIFFTSGGTESDNWAIKGSAFGDPDKRATVTSQIEHHAILRSCAAIERLGFPVLYLKPDRYGSIYPSALEETISTHTRLVSVMLANNEIGTIQPIKELAAIAHTYGAVFHTDAVQAVGHIPFDVQYLGVDMLSASAHKFNGPKGVGFLYVKKGVQILPLHDGGSQEHGMRAGTENVAGIVCMATALQENIKKLDQNIAHTKKLEQLLLSRIKDFDFIFNGAESHLPGLLSLSFRGASGEAIMHRMDLKGISISTGSACDSVRTQISHVIQAIHVPPEYANGTIRISLGKDNTEEEVEQIAASLVQILG